MGHFCLPEKVRSYRLTIYDDYAIIVVMEKMNQEKSCEMAILPKEDKAHYVHEIENYCDRNRCSWEKAIHKLGFDEELANTDIYEEDFKDEQDLLNTPDYMEYSHINDSDYSAAEKLMDKTGISMHEALLRLGLINYDKFEPRSEILQNYEDDLEVINPEAPSVRIDKRNVCLRNALKLALSASQREGFIHKIEKDDDEIDVNHQAKRRNEESKAANAFLDEATGINSMRKAGVDEEIIAKMASDYHKNFRDEYTGTANGLKRDKFRRNLAHQVKVYDIYDVEPW